RGGRSRPRAQHADGETHCPCESRDSDELRDWNSPQVLRQSREHRGTVGNKSPAHKTVRRTNSAARRTGVFNRIRSRLRVRANPTVRGILRLSAVLDVGHLELRQGILGKRSAMRVRIDAVDLGGVEAEDVGLVFLRDFLVAELVAQLVADLEPLEG